MLMIKLLSVAVVIVIFVIGIRRFNQHCERKFGHAFFTKTAFCITAVVLCLLYAGYLWRQSALQSHGDGLNGLVLMGIGVLLAGWMVYTNVRRTDAVYGIGGSIAQLGLFSIVAAVFLPLAFGLLILQFFLSAGATPVYVVNR